MYEAYFGLSRRPFSSVPQVEHYFPAAAIEAARQTLVRCVERAEGMGIGIGPCGTGKTLLCQVLAAHLKGSFQVAVLLSGRLVSPRALLQAILFELGQPYRRMDEGELRLALADYLADTQRSADGLVLIVDEAHTLSLRLLEEIRMIANQVSGGQPRVQPILVGGAPLEERLANPRLDSLNQRIVARCYLESFDRAETQAYIRAELRAAGVVPERIVSAEACHAVYQATEGIPRLVNQLCDHALVLAYAAGRAPTDRVVPVDRAGVEEAWADLQQLPAPWGGDGGGRSRSDVVEFGGLDDEPDNPPTTASPRCPPTEGWSSDDDGPATISMLRADTDPAEQVATIQEVLDGLDDDSQPSSEATPEVELFFDPSIDPFAEEFEEEEVIVDRAEPSEPGRKGAARQEQPPADVVVDCGHEADSPDVSPGDGVEEAAEPTSLQLMRARCQEPLDELHDDPIDELNDEQVDEPADELSDEPVVETAAPPEPAEDAADLPSSETVPWQPQPEKEECDSLAAPKPGPDPRPMIIVENDYDDEEVAVVERPAAGGRQVYGRLFTKLRGSD